MKTPPFLKQGDTIAIVAPARKIKQQEIISAITLFKNWGLKVLLGENIHAVNNQFAGDDDQRMSDFQAMLDNENVKAIISARGGYGTIRIIDKLDFSGFVNNPKWIVGYSDITVLHAHIQQNFQVQSLHATMPINFPFDGASDSATESLRKALFGEEVEYAHNNDSVSFREGQAEAEVVGGHLSILHNLSGTSSAINTSGKILFLEDLDEYLYHVDRMMMNLKRSGMLDNLAGLIVGGMSDMRDNTIPFGKNAEQIIMQAVQEYNFPVCFNFPAGHIKNNLALYLGRKARLLVSKANISLKYY